MTTYIPKVYYELEGWFFLASCREKGAIVKPVFCQKKNSVSVGLVPARGFFLPLCLSSPAESSLKLAEIITSFSQMAEIITSFSQMAESVTSFSHLAETAQGLLKACMRAACVLIQPGARDVKKLSNMFPFDRCYSSPQCLSANWRPFQWNCTILLGLLGSTECACSLANDLRAPAQELIGTLECCG